MSKKPHFQLAYGVNDVPPFPHYFEEALPHAQILDKLGFRGDKQYLFHSKDKQGQAYYEDHESELSAGFYHEYFSDPVKRSRYFASVENLLKDVSGYLEEINGLDMAKLSDEDMAKLLHRTYELDSLIFSYFLVCQPHRTRLFEEEVKAELKKRVAAERLDSYLAELAVSEKLTRMGEEEIGWLSLVVKFYSELKAAARSKDLQLTHPELYKAVENHFKQYKILTIGDGSWSYNIGFFVDRISHDASLSLDTLKEKLKECRSQSDKVKRARQDLAKTLYLEPDTIATINFLADMGFYRFNLRVDGFMPIIMTGIGLLREISHRKNISKDALDYLTPEEMTRYLNGELDYTEADAAKRMGANREYIIYVHDKKIETLYNEEAALKMEELAPPENLTGTTEVQGNPAMRGVVRGRVCLYQWGDKLDEKLESIKSHKILVAGHTRPAMMPLIRLAEGIVTDEGGVTSHAAIVSRELGLPSVINTRKATKVFKEGDLVELDANRGIVRKIG